MLFNANKHNISHYHKVYQLWTTMKLLKKKLLFCLFTGQNEGELAYRGYSWLYFRTSEFDRGSVRDAVNELVGDGLVDRLQRNHRSLFRLTAAGREILLKKLPCIQRGAGWDRHWRLVILAAPFGAALRGLQQRLAGLGYRRLSRGVYLCCLGVTDATREMLLANHWLNQAMVIESRRVLGVDDQVLARNLWHLENLERQYRQFITLADRLLKLSRRNLVLLQQAKYGFKGVFDRYYQLMVADPALPKALMPPDWPFEAAKDLFWRLAELAKTAKI